MNKNIHQTTLKDLRVLEALTEDNFAARTTAELAEKLNVTIGDLRASLNTLREAEYVRQNGSRWELTARLAMFAKELVQKAGESANAGFR